MALPNQDRTVNGPSRRLRSFFASPTVQGTEYIGFLAYVPATGEGRQARGGEEGGHGRGEEGGHGGEEGGHGGEEGGHGGPPLRKRTT